MQNTRGAAEKYTEYFCSIEVLLPDRIVVPTTLINAIGAACSSNNYFCAMKIGVLLSKRDFS
jgi:hypothetical protein